MPTMTYSQAPISPTLSHGDFSSGPDAELPLSTLDEPVWETIKRDLVRIGANLVLVVFPFKNWDQQSAALRNWDLWGPMVSPLQQPLSHWPCTTSYSLSSRGVPFVVALSFFSRLFALQLTSYQGSIVEILVKSGKIFTLLPGWDSALTVQDCVS